MRIPFLLNEQLWNMKIRKYEAWDTATAPHIAISGVTGVGKTYLVKLILAKVARYIFDAQLTVCDFKGDADFAFLKGAERFFRFDECIAGFNVFYADFVEVQRGGTAERPFRCLLFDEWQAAINYLDKKEAEELKKKLATLLMLGRSFNYHIVLSQQRLDAESFGKARDNFNVVVTLGNPSKEVIGMLYADYRDEIKPDRQRGTGYMLVNGSEFRRIIVPTITSMSAVEAAIRRITVKAD